MLYGHLLVWQPCGLYAHHLYGWACGLKVYQLYDELVISVLVSCPLIPSSYLWTMVGIMMVCTPYDKDLLIPFTSHWTHFMLHIWSWPDVIHSLVGCANEVFSVFPLELHVFPYKTSHLPFWPFVFSKFLSSFSTFSDKFLLIFALFMVDYATVRLDSPLVSFFFARLGVFLSLLVAIVLRWGSFCLKILFLG